MSNLEQESDRHVASYAVVFGSMICLQEKSVWMFHLFLFIFQREFEEPSAVFPERKCFQVFGSCSSVNGLCLSEQQDECELTQFHEQIANQQIVE